MFLFLFFPLFLLAAWLYTPHAATPLSEIVKKITFDFLKKSIDKRPGLCYYNYRKRKEATEMAKDYLEIMGDAMDELNDWLAFEADMATNPWG